ncbi:MAG: citrate synthase, partial [Pigmentiphaga sp.]|nr:citrate synthase [Pigmentiphaga sp.]
MFVSSPRLLTADEALRILSVRRQTLYAYVSKGWIRSVALPNSREHRYVHEDVQRVHQRALARAGHRAAASVALSGDTPLISSAISELRADGPWYRGHSALELANRNVPFEAVCHLLWQGEL